MSGGPHKNQMTWPPIVSNKLIKVLDSLLGKYIVFQRNREAGQPQGPTFSFFLWKRRHRVGVRSTYFYYLKSDFIVWNWFGWVSEFYIDHSASKESKLVSWGRKKFPPRRPPCPTFSFFLKTHTRRGGVRSTYFYYFKSELYCLKLIWMCLWVLYRSFS